MSSPSALWLVANGVEGEVDAEELVVEHIETLDRLHAIESEWRMLEASSALAVPFLSFDWATVWWKHFREDKKALQDRLFTRAVRTVDGHLVAVAPMMLTHRPAVGPLRVREVQFFGADPNITELRGMLCLPGREEQAHAALVDDLHRCEDRWDWVRLAGIESGSAIEDALDAGGTVRWQRDVSNFVLPLRATWDEQRAALRRNIKQSIRKCYNAPLRDHHDLRFEVVTDAAAIPGALDHFFRLHEARAQVTSTTPHPDVFASPRSREFLVDICDRLAVHRSARVFLLHAGDAVVAARVGFVCSGALYLYYSGYDPAWGKYSVSTRVTVEAIRHAISGQLSEVNLSTGADVSKTRWDPQVRVTREGFLPSSDRRSRITFAGFEKASTLAADTLAGRLGRRLLARRATPGAAPPH